MWKPPERVRHSLLSTVWPTAEQAKRSPLYEPIRLGESLQLRERTWVPAMVPWRATADGRITPDVLDWYGRFADGQPGAIVVEATGIRDIPSGPLLRIGHDRYVEGLKQLVETVRERSAGQTRLFIQLIDFLQIRRRPDPNRFFREFWSVTDHHRQRLASVLGTDDWLRCDEADIRSAVSQAEPEIQERILSAREWEDLQRGYRERVTDTHLPHIAQLPQVLPALFSQAAQRAEAAGFDGVELHYAHAYTMASFLSAHNTRTDGYGGPIEHRLRLPVEVAQAVQDAVSSSFVVGCRFLCDEVIEGGNRISDALVIGETLARSGLDFLSLSTGGKFEDAQQPKIGHAVYPYTGQSGYECMPTKISDEQGPFARHVPKQSLIRSHMRAKGLQTPTIVAGGICTFDQADRILREGDGDIVAAARQSLADPDWFLKMRLGRGTEIRRCEYTNYCEALDQRHKMVTCRLWDRKERQNVTTTPDGRRTVAPPWSKESFT